MDRRRVRWREYWREMPAGTRLGCVIMLVIIAIAWLIIDPKAKPSPEIDRLRSLLNARGISCASPYYWWTEPKGRSTLNCDRFEIDVFNNPAEVKTFVARQKSRGAGVLKRFGAPSYLVIGRRWVVITPSNAIATQARRAAGGRSLVLSRGP